MLTNNLFKRWTYKFFAPDILQRKTYDSFKKLLIYDRSCHELIADLQDLLYKKEPTDWSNVVFLHNQLSDAVGGMAKQFVQISSRDATELSTYYRKFDSYIRCLLQPESTSAGPPFVVWLEDPQVKSEIAGTKAANLAAIHQNFDFSIPSGFVITTNSWHALVEYNDLRKRIDSRLINLNASDNLSLLDTSQELIEIVRGAVIPPEIDQAIQEAQQELVARTGSNPPKRFAVRSSGVNEDGPNSFAGQYQSVLGVPPEEIHRCYLRVLSSKYTPKALSYRIATGMSDTESSMAVLVVEMIKAKGAGVTYTSDPTGVEEDSLLIHSVTGGGEKLVSGKAQAHISRFTKKGICLKNNCEPQCPITKTEAQKLARMAIEIETFFGSSQDIEWAIEDGEPYILQSRPLQITSPSGKEHLTTSQDASISSTLKAIKKSNNIELPLLYHGGTASAQGRGAGPAFFLDREHENVHIPANAILIVENTPTSLILFLPKCSAVISTQGSVASHFSTICREFRIPLIVGAVGIDKKLDHGEMVTVDADSRNVYKGKNKNYSSETCNSRKKLLPYYRRLQLILDFIAPLNILDPEAASFSPEFCRSFHDIVRYAHEKSVQAMFAIGTSGSRSNHRKQLLTSLPFELYLIDVDKAIHESAIASSSLRPDQIRSIPFRALWHGLTDPSIAWEDHVYYNWKDYDSAAMTDGFAFKNSKESASYAICGHDYLNLNIRFGYHFTIIDTLCGENSEQNYCSIRFAGGGGTFEGRYYRLQYVEAILRKLGFLVTSKTDLLDARLEMLSSDEMAQRLVTVGRMLGTSKLMDMVLKDEESVESHLKRFFNHSDTITEQDMRP